MAFVASVLFLDVGAATARSNVEGRWPIRWSAPSAQPVGSLPGSGAVAAPAFSAMVLADGARAVTVAQPLSEGVTVTGLFIPSSIEAGAAADALGAPTNLSHPSLRAGVTGAAGYPRGLPLARAYLTSSYGTRRHPLLGGRRLHSGIDLAAPAGTPVTAPSGGVVRLAGWNGGYGLFIEIDHGGGVRSRYGHMSRLNVVSGQVLRGGDVIGFVGSTGRSTGAHLHYEIIEGGLAVDPLRAR